MKLDTAVSLLQAYMIAQTNITPFEQAIAAVLKHAGGDPEIIFDVDNFVQPDSGASCWCPKCHCPSDDTTCEEHLELMAGYMKDLYNPEEAAKQQQIHAHALEKAKDAQQQQKSPSLNTALREAADAAKALPAYVEMALQNRAAGNSSVLTINLQDVMDDMKGKKE